MDLADHSRLASLSSWFFSMKESEVPVNDDDPFGFDRDPMAWREFLDIHDEISTPWFRIRFFFALWWERLCLALFGPHRRK